MVRHSPPNLGVGEVWERGVFWGFSTIRLTTGGQNNSSSVTGAVVQEVAITPRLNLTGDEGVILQRFWGNHHLNRLSPEYITDELVWDHWFKGDLFEWLKQTVGECHASAFKKRLDGYTVTEVWCCWFRYWPWRCCRCQEVSHILIDIQLIPPTAHTWYVMRIEKYTISISEICLCVSVGVCVHACLLDSVWINGHACSTAVNTGIVGMVFSVQQQLS